ncbi:MAG: translocation/assembly module TamB domain-containing protein [Terriglobia bacterium]
MKSRRILYIGLAAFLVVMVLCLAGVQVLRSRAFHRYLLATIVERAQRAVGGRVEIGDFTLDFARARADLYRIAIQGTGSNPREPLLRADHLAVELSLASLRRRELRLDEVIVDHPVVHFSVNSQGRNNLPAIPPAPAGSKPMSVFDLAIRHVALNDGEIFYNDSETPLQAELRDLRAQSRFDASRTEYDGSLSYRDGRIRYGAYNPLQHNLEATIEATPSGLTLKSLQIASGTSRISAQAQLQNYSNPTVDGSYDVRLATGEFRKILKNAALPAGQVSMRGKVHYQNQAGQPLLNNLAVEGDLSSPSLEVENPQVRAAVQALQAVYRLNQGELEVRQMQANILGGHVTAQLSMKNLAGTPVAHVEAKVSGLSFADATSALANKPPVRIAGRLDGTAEAGWRGSMQDLEAKSDLTIAAATPVATVPGGARDELPLDGAVHLSYDGPRGVLTLRQSSLHTPHTTVNLNGSVSKNSSLGIQVNANDLSEIDRLILTFRNSTPSKSTPSSQPPQLLGLGGSASFVGQAQGSLAQMRLTGSLSGANLRYQGTTLPALHANVELSPTGAALHQGQVQIGVHGRAQLDASVGLRNWACTPQSPINARLTANNVPVVELEHLANLQYPAGGNLTANLSAHGPLNQLRATGNLSGVNLQYQNTAVPVLRTNIEASPSGVALHQAQVQIGTQGRIQLDASVGLNDWSYTPQSPIRLQMTANNVHVEDLEHLANVQYPVSGNLSADVSVEGSQTNPQGHGTVRLALAHAWDQAIQDSEVQFDAANNTIRSTVNLSTPAGSGNVKLAYSTKDQSYDAQVDFPGIRLDKLQSVQARDLGITGLVKVFGQGRGTIKQPGFEATVEAPSLEFRQQKLDGLKVQATLAGGQAAFTVDSSVQGAYVRARGTINLSSNYDANVNIDTRTVQLGPLLAAYLPTPGVQGQTELHASIKGPLKQPELLEGHVEVPTFSLNYQSVQIANASPIRIDYRGRTLTLDRTELKGTGTDLELQAVVPVGGEGSLRASATGNIDLHIIQLLNSQFESSGQLKLDLSAQGALSHPDLRGQVGVNDAAFQASGAPLGADKVNAEFDIQGGQVDIKSFSAVTGGGKVTAKGYAAFQPEVKFDVTLSADDVRLRYPEGVRAVLKSDLNMAGTPDAATLKGQVLVDRLSFTPDFDLTTFADQFSGNSAPPSAGFLQNVKMNVAVKSTQEMNLASSQVSVQGSANLRVSGTLAEPVILGRTEISGGELFFNNLRFQVEHGTIQFANPVTTEPVLNIAATTTVQQFNVTVNLVGPLDRLRATYTSDPPLASVDIISLLFIGQTTEASAANPSTPQSVVAGQVAGQVSNRLGKLAGISSLTIDPGIGGNQSNPGTSLGIQQRVTKNLFFTFTTDLTTTQGDIIQVEYQITKKYALSAVASQNQGYSLEVKMHKKF